MICHLFDQILVILVILVDFGSGQGSGRVWTMADRTRQRAAQSLAGSGEGQGPRSGGLRVRFWPFWPQGQNLRVRGQNFWSQGSKFEGQEGPGSKFGPEVKIWGFEGPRGRFWPFLVPLGSKFGSIFVEILAYGGRWHPARQPIWTCQKHGSSQGLCLSIRDRVQADLTDFRQFWGQFWSILAGFWQNFGSVVGRSLVQNPPLASDPIFRVEGPKSFWDFSGSLSNFDRLG